MYGIEKEVSKGRGREEKGRVWCTKSVYMFLIMKNHQIYISYYRQNHPFPPPLGKLTISVLSP